MSKGQARGSTLYLGRGDQYHFSPIPSLEGRELKGG